MVLEVASELVIEDESELELELELVLFCGGKSVRTVLETLWARAARFRVVVLRRRKFSGSGPFGWVAVTWLGDSHAARPWRDCVIEFEPAACDWEVVAVGVARSRCVSGL